MELNYPLKIISDKSYPELINGNLQVNIPKPANKLCIKSLNINNVDAIHKLLKNNYVVDNDNIFRIFYSKEYLRWYLSNVPRGLAIGLCIQRNTNTYQLIGFISSCLLNLVINKIRLKMPHCYFLCLHKKIRKCKIAKILIRQLIYNIHSHGIKYGMFYSNQNYKNNFTKICVQAIPINIEKLKKIGFIDENYKNHINIGENPLRLTTNNDLKKITTNLNLFLKKYILKPYITYETSKYFFSTVDNVSYSYCTSDHKNFVNVYVSLYHCLESNAILRIATLGFYYYDELKLDHLIILLINNLAKQRIDKLIFYNWMDNETISLETYEMCDNIYYYMYNATIAYLLPNQIAMFPFF